MKAIQSRNHKNNRWSGRTIALVTGANRGIGKEIAKQLAQRNMFVFLGSRDFQRGIHAANELASGGFDVTPLQLDVTDVRSVEAAFTTIQKKHRLLDVLINNAGKFIGNSAVDTTATDMRQIFDVNVFGIVTVIRTFLPLLRLSKSPRIINVSSSTASLTMTSNDVDIPGDSTRRLAYTASKAALNMLTIQYSKAFARDQNLSHVKINCVTPGYTATDMNNFSGNRSVEESARIIVDLATAHDNNSSGRFLGDAGSVPW